MYVTVYVPIAKVDTFNVEPCNNPGFDVKLQVPCVYGEVITVFKLIVSSVLQTFSSPFVPATGTQTSTHTSSIYKYHPSKLPGGTWKAICALPRHLGIETSQSFLLRK